MRRIPICSMLLASTAAVGFVGPASAAAITLPQPLYVTSTTDTGVIFNYAGNVSTTDTLSFTAAGEACLQSNSTYCTNAAGVVVVAGSSGVGGSSVNPANSTTYGSLLLTIGGQTEQVFPTTAMNGAGSGSPSTALSLSSTSLSSLGFSFATLSNPTIEFNVSDQTFYRSDNTGGFSLTQSGSAQPVPEPVTTSIVMAGLLGLGYIRWQRRS